MNIHKNKITNIIMELWRNNIKTNQRKTPATSLIAQCLSFNNVDQSNCSALSYIGTTLLSASVLGLLDFASTEN